jgi:hypothetical protein
MGMRIGFSRSSYEGSHPIYPEYVAPNPDPSKYTILQNSKYGDFLVIEIRYHGCTNFEGRKILVYYKTTVDDLIAQGSIDPHFCENEAFRSPMARFVPTEAGWVMACMFADMMQRWSPRE